MATLGDDCGAQSSILRARHVSIAQRAQRRPSNWTVDDGWVVVPACSILGFIFHCAFITACDRGAGGVSWYVERRWEGGLWRRVWSSRRSGRRVALVLTRLMHYWCRCRPCRQRSYGHQSASPAGRFRSFKLLRRRTLPGRKRRVWPDRDALRI